MSSIMQSLDQVFAIVLSVTGYGCILAAVIAAVCFAGRRRIPPTWRYALWTLVLVRLLMPIAPKSGFSIFNLTSELRTTESIETTDTNQITSQPRGHPSNPELQSWNDSSPVANTAPGPSKRPRSPSSHHQDDADSGDEQSVPISATATRTILTTVPNLWRLAGIVWFVGATVFLVHLVRQQRRLARLRRRWKQVKSTQVEQILKQCKATLNIVADVDLRSSSLVHSPATCGLLRPCIVIPEATLLDGSRSQLTHIILHELTHIRRRDVWIEHLALLARALHWFNPAIWICLANLRRERELAVDQAVLNVLEASNRHDYGQALIQIAQHISATHSTPGLLGILGFHILRQRVEQIARYRATRWRWHLFGGLLFGLLASIGLTNANLTAQQTGEVASVEDAEATDENQQPQILVKLVDKDDQPIADGEVHASLWTNDKGFNRNRKYPTNEKGIATVQLPNHIDIFRIWSRADGYVPIFANWERGDTTNIPKEFTVKMQRAVEIGGVVVDQRGKPVAGVRIEVTLESGGTKLDPQPRTRFDGYLAEADDEVRTDKSGKWSLNRAPIGDDLKLRLRFTHPNYLSGDRWGKVTHTIGELRAKTATTTLKDGVRISGVITKPDGKPFKNAVVTWSNDPYHNRDCEMLTDENGRYTTPPLGGKPNITVLAEGYAPDMREVDTAVESKPCNFQLKPGKTMKIRFVNKAGEPVTDAWVFIEGWRGHRSLYNNTFDDLIPSNIPRGIDDNGVYTWNWAPDDEISFTIDGRGIVRKEFRLSAKETAHKVILSQAIHVTGFVTDAKTGKPIKTFRVAPAHTQGVDADGVRMIHRWNDRPYKDGQFDVSESDVPDGSSLYFHIEAEGYRVTAVGPYTPDGGRATEHVKLEPAAILGRVLTPDRKPVKNANVMVATMEDIVNVRGTRYRKNGGKTIATNAAGEFTFPARRLPHSIIAEHELGYAEVQRAPEDQPGDLVLRPWASVKGRYMDNGKPIADAMITATVIREVGYGNTRIHDTFETKTDREGRFVFKRLPPVAVNIGARLHEFTEKPIRSSHRRPLKLEGGKQYSIELGSDGATVTGKFKMAGEKFAKSSMRSSYCYLYRKDGGIEAPRTLADNKFVGQKAWNFDWMKQSGGWSYLMTQDYHIVRLDKDGSFLISGVRPGSYQLAIDVHDPNDDIEARGEHLVAFDVVSKDVGAKDVDLGTIEVKMGTPKYDPKREPPFEP